MFLLEVAVIVVVAFLLPSSASKTRLVNEDGNAKLVFPEGEGGKFFVGSVDVLSRLDEIDVLQNKIAQLKPYFDRGNDVYPNPSFRKQELGGCRDPEFLTGVNSGCAVFIGDFDGDGQQDMGCTLTDLDPAVVADPQFRLFYAADGYSPSSAFFGGGYLMYAPQAVDLNQDGQDDLVGNVSKSMRVCSFINSTYCQHETTSSAGFDTITQFEVGDLTGNGKKTDIAIAFINSFLGRSDHIEDSLTYTSIAIINGGALPPVQSVTICDIDADGFNDIIVVDFNGEIAFYLQRAMNSYTRVSVINASATVVKAGDIDNDGDCDLVYTDGLRLMLMKNVKPYQTANPRGMFEERVILDVSMSDSSSRIELADIDNDGDLDVFFASRFSQDLSLRYLEYMASTDSFRSQIIGTGLSNAITDLRVADVDGNGWKDVLLASGRSAIVFWSDGIIWETE